MAQFEGALKRLLTQFEGVYSDDPDDYGLETCFGISRRWHPDWPGWGRVEAIKLQIENWKLSQQSGEFEQALRQDLLLMSDVQEFYRKNFWMPIVGEGIFDQAIAEEVFEAAVNIRQGTVQAVQWLQRALNALNRQETLWEDLLEDGYMGGKTLAAIRRAITCQRSAAVVKLQNGQQRMYYMERMRKDPSQEKFALGWLSRT